MEADSLSTAVVEVKISSLGLKIHSLRGAMCEFVRKRRQDLGLFCWTGADNLTVAEKWMVDWLLELRGAETGAAAGQNDKNNENSDPVYFCKTSYLSFFYIFYIYIRNSQAKQNK